MWVRVLGSAAGGGFPQWNCACPPCRAVRDGSRPARPRTQSSIAVSADRRRWFLLNASPDIRAQIESFPALHPSSGPDGARVVPLQAVLLTDAELDHTLGLLLLREGGGLVLHATEATHVTLRQGTSLLTIEAEASRAHDVREALTKAGAIQVDEQVSTYGSQDVAGADAPIARDSREPGGPPGRPPPG